ncbi:MAG TPA: hypothetical protein VEA69_10530 [Tepidisphaeraceae bacterium]|nr:hypothetical protein [Tepidisphaeraceae bacterium]
MPAELILDTVKDAQIETVRDRVHVRRTGLIKGIDTTLPCAEVFATAINVAGMPQYFDAFPLAAYSYARLTRHIFTPESQDVLRFALLYEPIDFNPAGGGISFFLTRRTTLVELTTEFHPRTSAPMRVKWENKADPNPQATARANTVGLRYLSPMQVLTAHAWVRGAVPDAMLNCIGHVNEHFWRDGASGRWLCTGEEDRTQDRARSYSFSFEFTKYMQKGKDWSSYAVYRDPVTGIALPYDPNDLDVLKAMAYKYDVILKNGLLKAGLYDVADFGAAFGFGRPGDPF